MKKIIGFLCKPALLLTAVFLWTGYFAAGQGVSDAQSFRKVFPTTTETTVEVENKYGTILIVPWNKDSVQITAEVFLRAKSICLT